MRCEHIVIDRNCSLAEVPLRLSAAHVVATIYNCYPTWQQKQYRYPSIERARLRHYTADTDISQVEWVADTHWGELWPAFDPQNTGSGSAA